MAWTAVATAWVAGRIGLAFGLASGVGGCAHMLPGITVGDRDEGVAVSTAGQPGKPPSAAVAGARLGKPAAEERAPAERASTAVAAAVERPRELPRSTVRTLAVVRVLALPTRAEEPMTLDPTPSEEQTAFSERLRTTVGGAGVVWLSPTLFTRPPGLSRLFSAAAAEGADHLLVYQHRTPRRESGTLVYSVTFESCATARLFALSVGRAEPIAELEGRCTGTLGG